MGAHRLLVIGTSTRPGRTGPAITAWLAAVAGARGDLDVQVVDLAELALPLFDEPGHPRLGRYEHEHTREWSRIVAAADAVVWVFPEYNHSFPASLKNALDYLHGEWADKPVGFVTYGGASGGMRAAESLRPVTAAVRMLDVVEQVAVPFVSRQVDGGVFTPTPPVEHAASAMLDEMVRLARLVRPQPVAARVA